MEALGLDHTVKFLIRGSIVEVPLSNRVQVATDLCFLF